MTRSFSQCGQLEEGTGHAAHLVDLRLGHAVARDHEEADLAAGVVHLGGDARLVFSAAREKRRDIDDRDQDCAIVSAPPRGPFVARL